MSTEEKPVQDNEVGSSVAQNESSSLTAEAQIEELPVPIDARNDSGQSTLQSESNSQEAQGAPPGFDMSIQPDTTSDQAVTEIDFPDDHFEAFIEELEDKEFFQRHGVRPEQRQAVIQDPQITSQIHRYMEETGSRFGVAIDHQGSMRFEGNRNASDRVTVDSVLHEDESVGVEEVDEEPCGRH
jgi:hypothetical protein